MTSPGSWSAPNRPGRTWRVPPALVHDPGDALEGLGVLNERGGGPLSVVLWQVAREVLLWAQAGERAGLFARSAYGARLGVLRSLETPPELEPLLRGIAEAVLVAPETAEPEHVARLCRRVSDWAMGRGAGETSLMYAQAAALAVPGDAGLALHAGGIGLRLGRLQRAESWLLRAVALARKRDWNTYGLAYLDLARAAELRGNRIAARRRLVIALRAGRRWGLREVRGRALHGLLRLALDDGALSDAGRYARAAERYVGIGHPERPALDADRAALYVATGETPRALLLLRDLLRVAVEPERRMFLLALQAEAYGSEGRAEGRSVAHLAEAWSSAWSLASGEDGGELRVRALLALARAARAAGELRRAHAAEEAARAAARGPLDRWLLERYED
ncbi:MAG TPA: hypothetical protein VFR81_04580 [Longimicrobium sp.]|nr:hypothetical protein [Longimicrobium sp.]